jgi:hypothetical protein
LFSETIIV